MDKLNWGRFYRAGCGCGIMKMKVLGIPVFHGWSHDILYKMMNPVIGYSKDKINNTILVIK